MKNLISIENLSFAKDKILYFYKPDLNYHSKFIKMMSFIEKDFGIEVSVVNILMEQSIPKRFGFSSIPCLIYYKNKKEYKRHEGMISYKDLKKLFKLKN